MFGRLHVAVNEPLCLGSSQPGCGLHSDSQNLDEREWPVAIESALQRRPSHIRHDEIGEPIRIRHAVDFNHVVMNHRGSRAK